MKPIYIIHLFKLYWVESSTWRAKNTQLRYIKKKDKNLINRKATQQNKFGKQVHRWRFLNQQTAHDEQGRKYSAIAARRAMNFVTVSLKQMIKLHAQRSLQTTATIQSQFNYEFSERKMPAKLILSATCNILKQKKARIVYTASPTPNTFYWETWN